MNKVYKVIWNKVKHCYVVVSEIAKSNGKSVTMKSQSGKSIAAALTVFALCLSMTGVVSAAENAEGTGMGVAIGSGSAAKSNSDVAVGKDANATGYSSAAIGISAKATGQHSVAMGEQAAAAGDSAIAIGRESMARGPLSVAIGYQANADMFGMAIGVFTKASSNSAAFGYLADASGTGAVAFGSSSQSLGSFSTAIGGDAKAMKKDSTAIGHSAKAEAEGAMAFGHSANSKGSIQRLLGRLQRLRQKELWPLDIPLIVQECIQPLLVRRRKPRLKVL